MKIWRVILATLVIYGAGVMTGALLIKLDRQIYPAAVRNDPAVTKALPPMPVIAGNNQKIDFLQKLDRQLRLKPEQYEALEKIMDESHKRTKGIRDKIAPQIQAETTRLNGEIRAKLTPDQAKKFDEIMKPRPARKGDEKIRKKKSAVAKVPSGGTTNVPPVVAPVAEPKQ